MKKISFMALGALMVVMTSCKKDNGDNTGFYISARKNNIAWVAQKPYMASVSDKADSLLLIGQNGEETLRLKIKSGTGSFHLQNGQASYYTTVGLDALVSEYKLINAEDNTVTISNYDTSQNLVIGTFNLHFEKLRGSNSDPVKIDFANGKIRGKLSVGGKFAY